MPTIDIKVPDIGDFKDVAVIELLVKPGDTVKLEQSLITVESDKASMEIPSSHAGLVKELKVQLGDNVREGSLVLLLETSGAVPASGPAPTPAADAAAAVPLAAAPPAIDTPPVAATTVPGGRPLGGESAGRIAPTASLPLHEPMQAALRLPHASPSVRRFARELGVPLAEVQGSGLKGRITPEDVQAFVKKVMAGDMRTAAQAARPAASPTGPSAGGAGFDLLPWPKVDFAKFGAFEVLPLSRIKKISGQNLARNWVMIPAVTYHEDADITELEAFRVAMNKENEKSAQSGNLKITMLAFLIKVCELALRKFPEFNSSLDGDNLVMKKYFHIAFAADTPNGLVVPVVKNVDQKSVSQIVIECGELAKKARDGKLGPADMSGACFTISSVGGIGGTSFSPIVNAPEVAILGVSKTVMKPVWNGKEFVPRLILPLSLSADHRVIDGALATRFNVYVAQLLADMRRALI